MHFGHIHLSSTNSSNIHSHLPTPPTFKNIFENPWSPVCDAQIILSVGPSPGICSTCLPGVISLKKTEFPSHSPSSYQMTITPWLGMGLCACFPLRCLAFVWIDLTEALCMLSQLLWIYACISPVASRKYCFLVLIQSLWLLQSSELFFHNDAWILGKGMWSRHLIWSSASHSPYSLHIE